MKFLNKIEEYFLGVSLAIMVIINFGNVLSRYFLRASWSFTEEVVIIIFVWNSILAAAVAYKHGAHLGLSVLTDLLPEKMQRYVGILGALATTVLMAILYKYGMEMVRTQMRFSQATPVLGIPSWIPSSAIPIGALFIIIRAIQSSYIAFKEGGK
ncbi:TRAP-type C4-dicarboxylate transport system, small permease component [Natronincola peptidivorans]|uniref:TRAP-type C4-dicarboxylate transport system, small permease component n=1 Tax=Natronincola peptidivorans TaxID=426128 RepID=A0A1I0BPC2_9FIRM|nr:TRAP transporter small permease [Natronincola peptidivorans]SET08125.1 TRAP-type C4-dicarboxylate transport system, small permease component [Natronincola peptidivorans]